MDKRCPNCRREYDPSLVQFDVDQERVLMEQKKREKKKKQKKERMRRDLPNVRVIQRNLVYIVGIPQALAKENVLLQKDYFNQYGPIIKIVVNRPQSAHFPHRTTCSAYITFETEESALMAIQCVDGAYLHDKCLRASFGTTKYCSYFLRGIPCTNPECMYLHKYGDDTDTFTKEDMLVREAAFQSSIHPPSHPDNHLWRGSGLPPPRPLGTPLSSIAPPPDRMSARYGVGGYRQGQVRRGPMRWMQGGMHDGMGEDGDEYDDDQQGEDGMSHHHLHHGDDEYMDDGEGGEEDSHEEEADDPFYGSIVLMNPTEIQSAMQVPVDMFRALNVVKDDRDLFRWSKFDDDDVLDWPPLLSDPEPGANAMAKDLDLQLLPEIVAEKTRATESPPESGAWSSPSSGAPTQGQKGASGAAW
eukprot:TRINITY_DN2000_c0_g1_i2.p1 TRINITY_DN2000_c0_g1~~TRINITY_DN2000_c0_g1_i2.p1  ORF type:complete len:415 (-),score=133.86 TRINITY_DN2000_c0_g1_i2:38-1282(-)